MPIEATADAPLWRVAWRMPVSGAVGEAVGKRLASYPLVTHGAAAGVRCGLDHGFSVKSYLFGCLIS